MRPVLLVLLLSSPAWAKQNGIATTSCSGCHGPGATVTITGPQQSIAVGATVTLTVTVSATGIAVGGFFMTSGRVGTFTPGAGQQLIGDGVGHSTPKAASNGKVTFSVTWTAPSTAGGGEFSVGAVGGNGDGRSSGDHAGFQRISLAWGCAGTPYYADLDGDGHGNALDGPYLRCGPSTGLSDKGDDCDDNDALVFPGAVEACNGRDDNCNGQIDEGLAMTTTWPDLDSDGYGDPKGPTQMGCAGSKRAANNRDCNDNDPTIHPGAMEVCNLKDDDCDAEIDNGVHVRCGVGWCARYGPTCDPSLCMPGYPRPEECNAFDDDCDGVDDNGNPCDAGFTCFEGQCYAEDAPLPADAGDGGSTQPGGCQSAPGAAALVLLGTLLRRRRR
jgi:hypothetical protein